MKQKILATLLAVTMIFTSVDTTVLAASTNEKQETEEIKESIETTQESDDTTEIEEVIETTSNQTTEEIVETEEEITTEKETAETTETKTTETDSIETEEETTKETENVENSEVKVNETENEEIKTEETTTEEITTEEVTVEDLLENDNIIFSYTMVNPLYKDVVSIEELEAEIQNISEKQESKIQTSGVTDEVFDNINAVSEYICEQMVIRENIIGFYIASDIYYDDFLYDALDTATLHTEDCSGQEGDALLWGYKGFNVVNLSRHPPFSLSQIYTYIKPIRCSMMSCQPLKMSVRTYN